MSTKQKILNTTVETIKIIGIKNLRVDKVCKDTNVSKRTMYEIFTDKQNLIKEALIYMLFDTNKKMLQIIDESDNVIDAISKLNKFELRTLKTIPEHILNEIKEYALNFNISPHQIEGVPKDMLAANIILKKGIEQGIFRNNLNIDTILAFLDQLSLLIHKKKIFGDLRTNSNKIKQSITEPYFRGLCTKKGIDMMEEIF